MWKNNSNLFSSERQGRLFAHGQHRITRTACQTKVEHGKSMEDLCSEIGVLMAGGTAVVERVVL